MLKPFRVILLALTIFSILLSPGQARADAIPFKLPGGAALDPGDATTQVRMVAETVTLEVAPPSPDYWTEAWITADFTFRNLGDAPEQMEVGFPLSCPSCIWPPTGEIQEINDLAVYINSLQVTPHLETAVFPSHYNDLSLNWAVFDATFPPGQDVLIRVTYTARAWFVSNNYHIFTYMLQTGSGWYDTIGSADIITRLPYPANALNTWLDRSGLTGDSPTIIPTISGHELCWHYENLEPQDDFEVTIVDPELWNSVLIEEENVRLDPRDGEAWGRLGLAFKQMLHTTKLDRTDPDAESIYSRAADAYEHATTLLPGDALWHAGYAELLFNHFFYTEYWGNWDRPVEDLSELTRAVAEVQHSLEIDPENELALKVLGWVIYNFPDAIQVIDENIYYPILTSTAPLAYLLQVPTSTISPTSTLQPTTTPVITVTSTVANTIASATALPPDGSESDAQNEQIPAAPETTPPVESSSGGRISLWWIIVPAVVLIAGLAWLLRRKRA